MGARSPSPHERGWRAEMSQVPVVPCLQGKGITRKEEIMRVFVTGATGTLGRYLVPGLIAAGHQVTAATKTAGKVSGLGELGADAVVVDAVDRAALIAAVRDARPEVIVHEMTALGGMKSLARLDRVFTVTNQLRTQG